MKVVFVSNYFNHHQAFFSEEMYHKAGVEYHFISTSTMREERRKLGYGNISTPEYVHLSYLNEEEYQNAMQLIWDADVVIAGSAPQAMLRKRIRKGKITFRYSERPFKMRRSALRKIAFAAKAYLQNFPYHNVYMLCASAFTAPDYGSVGLFRNKAYKWGYFPEMNEYDPDTLLEGKQKNHILWCGRFLDWKHPDDVITVASRLRDEGYSFTLDFIGTGELEEQLRSMTEAYGLADRIRFLGSMKPEQVREHMERAGIYVFTSDLKEGWGAVLNESMNSGCAVVASNAIGAAPFLLKDGENGLLYKSGNVDMLCEKVKYLLDHPIEQKRMGAAAYTTITECWNAKVAAERFMQLAERVVAGERCPEVFAEGPCSKA